MSITDPVYTNLTINRQNKARRVPTTTAGSTDSASKCLVAWPFELSDWLPSACALRFEVRQTGLSFSSYCRSAVSCPPRCRPRRNSTSRARSTVVLASRPSWCRLHPQCHRSRDGHGDAGGAAAWPRTPDEFRTRSFGSAYSLAPTAPGTLTIEGA